MPDTWEPITNERDIDADGVWHVGRGTKGCRHCGKVEVHYAENGKAAWHHPGVSCCRKATEDQLRWRKDDLERLRGEAVAARRAVDELRQRSDSAFGKEAADLKREVERAERGYTAKVERMRLLSDGSDELEIVGLKHEIAVLERKLASYAVRAA